ncbi:unnamed protein product [Cuscuta epithymum]|uniref:J domain-containing protein n=1 Tax=Cuscuta epithymum TaxID=186058 RepID=A0AAV0G2J0_9ASTE|nr:unnamed protein product [Cuscuta epithymum]
MRSRLAAILFAVFLFTVESKTLDPYKVLGVDKNANQRNIQKAFHKLSLKYHPDKNNEKGAQEKFAEINNAYEILSDEDKRKNYDLYGDEKGAPGFDPGNGADHGGYTHFTSGGPGQSGFSFRPGNWQNMGGQGGSKSFSFSFGGGPGSQGSSDFGLDDIFTNFFGGGMGGGSQSGGFSRTAGRTQTESGTRSTVKAIPPINSATFKKEIADKGITGLLLSYTSNEKNVEHYESIIGEVASSLQGALKVGKVNCGTDSSLCKELGLHPRSAPRLFVYSFKSIDSGSILEYFGDVDVKSVKSFCQEHLPRFSKRVNLNHFNFDSGDAGGLPKVMLLSTKTDTPVIWRVLSGLYRKRFIFYDVEVHDVSDHSVRRLGVDALPAVVGWMSNGEKHILKTGISVKDVKSAIQDLSGLLDNFEKKNKKVGSAQNGKSEERKQIPLLTGSNIDNICGEKSPVCIIGIFRSSKSRDKLEKILFSVSQKSVMRRQNAAYGTRESVSYAVLDGSKQEQFLKAFDKSGFKSADRLLLAYKPRRGKFAVFKGEVTEEEAQKFISDVVSGDIQFLKTKQNPSAR